MYRKYSPIRTYVLNSHHFLIAAEQQQTNQPTFFHQLLLPQSLPVLFDNKTLQNCIDESQNQNIVNQTQQGFEVYFDRNLVQVRVKEGMHLLSEVGNMPFFDVLQTVRSLNLDYAMAVKQLQANSKNSQMNCLNHCSRFYSYLSMKEGSNQLIIPFIQIKEHKTHYYDVFYGGMFAKPVEKTKKTDLKLSKNASEGQKKLKLKNGSMISGNFGPCLNQATAFRKYILFLVVMLTCEDIVELMQEFKVIASGEGMNVQIYQRIKKDRIKMGIEGKGFIQLLKRCLDRPEEYNINIFQKECELISDKYEKIKDLKVFKGQYEVQVKEKINLQNEQKIYGSRSMMSFKKKTSKQIPVTQSRPMSKKSNQRLKSSKSLINLKKHEDRDASTSSHKIKRPTLNIFKNSKMEASSFQNGSSQKVLKGLKSSKNIFENNSSSFMVKSFNFSKLGSTSSNWLNSSGMKESDTFNRLRHFKKGNQNTSVHVSPVNRLSQKNTESKGEKDIVYNKQVEIAKSEQHDRKRCSEDSLIESGDLKHLSRFYSKYNPKKMKKEEKYKPVIQEQTQQENSKYQFKQEEQNTKQQLKEGSQSVSKNVSKRVITNTVNLKLCQSQNKVQLFEGIPQKLMKQTVSKHQKQNQPNFDKVINSKQIKKQSSAAHQHIQNELKNKNAQLNRSLVKKPKGNYPMIKGTNLNDNCLDEQIQSINFKSSIVADSQLLSSQLQFSTTPFTESIELSPPKLSSKKKVQDRVIQTQYKQQENVSSFLSVNQKKYYTEHYVLILMFLKQNVAKLNILPHKNNLSYLLNLFYYKSMLENRGVESINIEKYTPLINLIKSKQAKIPQQSKKSFLIFRINPQSLYQKRRSVQSLQNKIRKRKNGQFIKEQEAKQELLTFSKITEECSLLLTNILSQLYYYFQSNKAMLINKNIFLTVLQWGYLINVTKILCLQRLKYYKWIKNPIQGQKVFTFQFKNSQKEYLQDYKNKVSVKQPAFMNCIQEYENLKSWVDQFE